MCLVVLQYLPGRPEALMIFHDEPGPENTASWSHVAISRIIKSLRQLFRRFEGSESFEEQVADVLCRNTSRPIQDTFEKFDDWIAQFCGPNIRWESIGLLWAHVEGLSDALSTLYHRQLQWVEGKQSSVISHEHLHYCIEITRQFTAGNDLLLDLCRRQAALGTLVYGDASPVYWNSHSLCISMLLFLGHHASGEASRPQLEPEKPSFCVENRRFIYSYIFAGDKSMVSFTGRPPLLSRRYCSSLPPLDLPDSCMTSEDTLTEEFNALDYRGWNTKGEVYSNSYIRARYLMSCVFDEVIEVALGKDAHPTIEYLQSIKARVTQTFIEMPSHLIFKYEDLDDPDLDIHVLYLRILLHLAHRRDIFVIERLLLAHGAIDDGSLLTISFDLVKVTVMLWIHKNRFAPMRRNFEWLLVAYGGPGAGILCQELLRPTFFGVHPLNPTLSRSNIVQQLTTCALTTTGYAPTTTPREEAGLFSGCFKITKRLGNELIWSIWVAIKCLLKPIQPITAFIWVITLRNVEGYVRRKGNVYPNAPYDQDDEEAYEINEGTGPGPIKAMEVIETAEEGTEATVATTELTTEVTVTGTEAPVAAEEEGSEPTVATVEDPHAVEGDRCHFPLVTKAEALQGKSTSLKGNLTLFEDVEWEEDILITDWKRKKKKKEGDGCLQLDVMKTGILQAIHTFTQLRRYSTHQRGPGFEPRSSSLELKIAYARRTLSSSTIFRASDIPQPPAFSSFDGLGYLTPAYTKQPLGHLPALRTAAALTVSRLPTLSYLWPVCVKPMLLQYQQPLGFLLSAVLDLQPPQEFKLYLAHLH
ncbi:hypothetical protein F53441_9392 [Fusarium austroafricanum]|uniref:Xylanolytic transcriptional activator regulatory domain-containing protein n=1 Tax=Fusarium austroafricanum TaxID=2364996 RepID=A0A8H4NWE5_9HYPO|nr:hypothetical protein F53441_9392 [Fusarium austroafricanum]